MCVVLLSMKRDFVREMEKYENVYVAAKWMKFQNKGWERVKWCVTWYFLYRAKHVTRLELVEGKFSEKGKIFDKVSGFISEILFFSQKKKVRDFNGVGVAVTTVNHCCHSWMMTSFAWKTILGIKFMIWLKMVK